MRFITDVMRKFKPKSAMKALQVYPVTERGEITVGVKFDEDTLEELVTQLMILKRVGTEFSIKSFKSDKRLFVTVEKYKEEYQS